MLIPCRRHVDLPVGLNWLVKSDRRTGKLVDVLYTKTDKRKGTGNGGSGNGGDQHHILNDRTKETRETVLSDERTREHVVQINKEGPA